MYPLYRRRGHWEAPTHWSPELPEMLGNFEDERSMTPAGLFGFPEGIFRRGYPVNIEEQDGDIIVEAELPGFTRDQIRVSIDEDVIRINAARDSVSPKGMRYLTERSVNLVNRTLRLPAVVDKSKAIAELEGGVLKITAPMVSGGHGSDIPIK